MTERWPLSASTLFLSRSWLADSESELAFVTRSLAGAASRLGQVRVVVPAERGVSRPDGAFDLYPIGLSGEDSWPNHAEARFPPGLLTSSIVIVDELDTSAAALLGELGISTINSVVAPHGTSPDRRGTLRFTPQAGADFIRLQVPVNPLAAGHRHNGLGFTGYLLVLSDRAHARNGDPPTESVAWLTAAFPAANVVVLEGGSAFAWRGRALRGIVAVDTRTDLWRLLAHALVTIDLSPGSIVARECVESLRFGTPIIVPEASAAAAHAEAGGGRTFTTFADLLDAAEFFSTTGVASEVGNQGRRYADENFGDSSRFVDSAARILCPR